MTDFKLLTRSDIRLMLGVKSNTIIRRLEKEGKLHQHPLFKLRYDPNEVNTLFGIKNTATLANDDYSTDAWK